MRQVSIVLKRRGRQLAHCFSQAAEDYCEGRAKRELQKLLSNFNEVPLSYLYSSARV